MAVALLFTGLTRHPKIKRAGEPAAWLFVCCLEYAAEWPAYNGFIPREAIEEFGLKNIKARIDKLTYSDERLGPLLHTVPGGYEINDYLQWNNTAKQRAERDARVSKARADAGRKGAATRWNGRLANGKPDGNCHTNANGKPDGSANSSASGKTMASDGTGSSSLLVSSSLSPSPSVTREPSDREEQTPRSEQEFPDDHPGHSVRLARRQAGLGLGPEWSLDELQRIAERITDPDVWAWLEVLARQPETRSPGRVLNPAAQDEARRRIGQLRWTAASDRRSQEVLAETAEQAAAAERAEHVHSQRVARLSALDEAAREELIAEARHELGSQPGGHPMPYRAVLRVAMEILDRRAVKA